MLRPPKSGLEHREQREDLEPAEQHLEAEQRLHPRGQRRERARRARDAERLPAYEQRLEIFAGLPDMLHDLYCHRLESLTPREPVRRAAAPDRVTLSK